MQTKEHGGGGGLGMRLEETLQYAEVKILGFPHTQYATIRMEAVGQI